MLDASSGENHEIRVSSTEFTSSENGELFATRLEGLRQELLSSLPQEARVQPSQVDHLIGIVRRDMTATVFVNEGIIRAQVRTARAIEAGKPATEDDIVDIASVSFVSPASRDVVVFPIDAGVFA